MKQHAPLLAATVDLTKVKYPVLVSPKLDGIRCLVVKGKPLSRKLKEFPNLHLRSMFAKAIATKNLEGLDGELILGLPRGPGVFQRTTSAVMSIEGEPRLIYYVFDVVPKIGSKTAYTDRFLGLASTVEWIKVLKHEWVTEEKQLLAVEAKYLKQGYEGLMGRDPKGIYKHGRSTMKEGILWKLVRYATDEATIVDFKEQLHNDNPAATDNLGHVKRSSAKAGKRGAGILGAFVVESENYRDVFDVGTGFSAAQRRDFWNKRKSLSGATIRYKHKPIGAVDVPRHPVFQGFRDKIDL